MVKYALSKMIAAALLLLIINVTAAKASVISYKKEADGLLFILDKGLMKVTVCKDDIIEVKYTVFDSFITKPSLIVNAKWSFPSFKVSEDKNQVTILTAKLNVIINKATNNISYRDLYGKEIASEDNKSISPATIAG
ncbi:MAG: DUF4968 domain-containing protein, partial [Mucilaginibacter sp.]